MKRFSHIARLAAILALIILLAALAACSASEPPVPDTPPDEPPAVEPGPADEPDDPPEPPPEEPPYDGPVSPLTGLPVDKDLSAARPYAIMINNLSLAQPQLGVSQADIIYETLAEGGITRMLAIYADVSDVGAIGSIRSARHYYLDLAQALDAIYIHAGGSDQAYAEISARGVPHLDGVHGSRQDIFYRDPDRRKTMGYEHSMVTTGELISEYVPTYGFRMEHEEGFDYGMTFTEDGTPAGGADAGSVSVYFTWGGRNKATIFEYDSEDKLYYLSQYDEPYIDGNDGAQLSVTNVIAIHAPMRVLDSEGRIDVDLVGSGSGYFACGGKYVDISWSKSGYTSRFVFTLEDGTELFYGQGRTYICIIPEGGSVEFS